jgi:hypothetical protein
MPRQDQQKDPKPLTREELKFVAAYRQYRTGGGGIYKAAEKAGIPKRRAVTVFNKPEIQEEIDRQDEAVREERAKVQVREEELTIDFANRELMKTIKQLEAKDDIPQRMEALRLVYVVTGKIQNGSTRVLDTPPPSMPGALHDPESQPPERFDYRALIQVIPQTPVPIVADQEERPAVDRGQTPQPVTGPQKNSGPVNKPTPQSPREEPTRKPKDGLPPPIRCG